MTHQTEADVSLKVLKSVAAVAEKSNVEPEKPTKSQLMPFS